MGDKKSRTNFSPHSSFQEILKKQSDLYPFAEMSNPSICKGPKELTSSLIHLLREEAVKIGLKPRLCFLVCSLAHTSPYKGLSIDVVSPQIHGNSAWLCIDL